MRTLSKYSAVLLVLIVMSGCLVIDDGEDPGEFDIIRAPYGQPTRHWWENVLWLGGAEMDNKAIEIKYTGQRFLLNYIKFVPVDGGEEVIWTAFDTAVPEEALVKADGANEYDKHRDKWGIRIDANMGDVGGQTLTAHDSLPSLPNLILYPELSGRYNIYFCMRAVDAHSSIAVRLIDVE